MGGGKEKEGRRGGGVRSEGEGEGKGMEGKGGEREGDVEGPEKWSPSLSSSLPFPSLPPFPLKCCAKVGGINPPEGMWETPCM